MPLCRRSAENEISALTELHPLIARSAGWLNYTGVLGFAMGDADNCLLVKRDSEGAVVLNVPKILLKPGELGCNPSTALWPSDQLRSPH